MDFVLNTLARKGFLAPRFHGRNILNLMASIIHGAGGSSPHEDLADALPVERLRAARHIVYLVLDGLGVAQLKGFLDAGGGRDFFALHPFDVLHTVCPATTAAAVTTFATGLSPAEHGVLGWHLHLDDLGMVATILPGVTRTGVPMVRREFDLGGYLNVQSRVAEVRRRRVLLSYAHIPRSRYSMALGRWDQRQAYNTLGGMVRQLARVLRGREASVVYAYWPGYDSHCHEYGCLHPRTLAHLRHMDRALGRLERLLQGTGTVAFITADHGLVDTPRTVDLSRMPDLCECLAILPSGDARQTHCFLRPSCVSRFERIVRTRLSQACCMMKGEDMLAAGLFGPGRPHPALRRRVGDRVLLARPGWAFGYTLPGTKPDFNKANHGGLSPEEVRVPMFTIEG